MRIVWDERKRQANIAKHGLDFASLNVAFFASATFVPGKRGRQVAIGELDGVKTVIFVRLGVEAISVVSMRPASRKERRRLDV